MKECKSCRVITKKRKGTEYFFPRLNLVDSESDTKQKKYTTKDIATNLIVSKRNQ